MRVWLRLETRPPPGARLNPRPPSGARSHISSSADTSTCPNASNIAWYMPWCSPSVALSSAGQPRVSRRATLPYSSIPSSPLVRGCVLNIETAISAAYVNTLVISDLFFSLSSPPRPAWQQRQPRTARVRSESRPVRFPPVRPVLPGSCVRGGASFHICTQFDTRMLTQKLPRWRRPQKEKNLRFC